MRRSIVFGIVALASSSVDDDGDLCGADPYGKQTCCRVGRESDVVRRGAWMDDERHRLRINARGVNAPRAPVDSDVEETVRPTHRHLAQPSLNFDLVLH